MTGLRRRGGDDEGFAMVLVLGLGTVLTLLVALAVTSATDGVRTSRLGAQNYTAEDAAQAGVQDFLYNLNRQDDYYSGSATPTVSTEVRPGSPGKYRVELLSTPDQVRQTGRILLRSTGTVRDSTRTLTVALGKESFLDYLYFTRFETVPPIAHSTPDWAAANCSRVQFPTPRPADCTALSFFTADGLTGPVYSQDQIRINGSPIFGGSFGTGWAGDGTRLWVDAGSGSSPQFAVAPISRAVPFPTSNDKLDAQSLAGSGCRYTGPTRILLRGTTMTVTSPYSPASPVCGTFTAPSYTATVPIPADGLVYVQDGAAGCDDAIRKPALMFPVDGDDALLSGNKLGYSCTQGDVLVEGTVSGRLSLAAKNNVVVTGDLLRAPASDAMLGLVAGSVVSVYHPVTCSARSVGGRCEAGTNVTAATVNAGSTTVAGRPTAYPDTDVRIEAVVLAKENGFLVQNHLAGAALGTLSVYGAIAQAYRGGVSTSNTTTRVSGYAKAYTYDERAAYAPPPYLASLADSAWVIKEFGEKAG